TGRRKALAELLAQGRNPCPRSRAAIVPDGQPQNRWAVAPALPGLPHRLSQFHYLGEGARPVFEADRHAKKVLKRKVRKIRTIERAVEGRADAEAEVIRGYCGAVRSALTDDGRPPLAASGLKLHGRLTAVTESLGRAGGEGGCRPNSPG